jgi:hypothetical protein
MMLGQQTIPPQQAQGQASQTPPAQASQEPTAPELSFEDLWRQEIERLTQLEEQQRWVQPPQPSYPKPPATAKGDSDGEEEEGEVEEQQQQQPSEFVKLAVKVAIQEGLSPLLREHPELEELGIVNLTKQYLSSFPPHAITPDLTKATALMFYGLYALKQKEYEAKKQAEQAKQTKPSLPSDEVERLRRYAEIWGLDPDDLYQKVLAERMKEANTR